MDGGRRLRHLELPERRQPAEGAAIPDRVGRCIARNDRQGARTVASRAWVADRGPGRIAGVLDDIATALELIVREVIDMMNAGEVLDTIVHSVTVPDDLLSKPYLRPLYDEPEFVVRGVWRQFGGWWDGAPSRLKPAPDAVLATELAELAGGAGRLIERAQVSR